MQNYKILWVDDEIELLKPHILFLTKKGYQVKAVNSGADALDVIQTDTFDVIFLDENMAGMTGLETLVQIKVTHPQIPVIMITKSEEEHIMEEALGAKISDYLIKPINPNQILLSMKKLFDNKRLVSEKTNQSYQQDFRNLSLAFNDQLGFEEWVEIYKKLIYWELEINSTQNQEMLEILAAQKNEANVNFAKFIIDHYEDWLNDPQVEKPLLSFQLMKKKVFPLLEEKKPVFFILIDNLRYDQWKIIEPMVSEFFKVAEESCYYSILPTTTAYARNSIFSGMMPSDMAKYHADIWVQEDDEEGKNLQEAAFLGRQLQKNRIQAKYEYHKIITQAQGRALVDNLNNMLHNQLVALVYNFVDMLSHARTDMNMIRELMPDESAFRSLTKSWFMHSPLFEMLKKLAAQKIKVVLTTDHGTIFVKKPFKIIGDRNVNTNLRYKQGKNLNYTGDKVMVAKNPDRFQLPKLNVSSTFVFAIEDYFFVYPNNYNYYVNFYKDTFQHGGISMEEMIVPFVVLEPK
ncbi:MAG TPA: two-component system response regulator [Microscillaceae bacterium]|jgi:DNA-binding response OmpR family regulator|nr:two-component system response regulator [Microscillaceae bacterium]